MKSSYKQPASELFWINAIINIGKNFFNKLFCKYNTVKQIKTAQYYLRLKTVKIRSDSTKSWHFLAISKTLQLYIIQTWFVKWLVPPLRVN